MNNCCMNTSQDEQMQKLVCEKNVMFTNHEHVWEPCLFESHICSKVWQNLVPQLSRNSILHYNASSSQAGGSELLRYLTYDRSGRSQDLTIEPSWINGSKPLGLQSGWFRKSRFLHRAGWISSQTRPDPTQPHYCSRRTCKLQVGLLTGSSIKFPCNCMQNMKVRKNWPSISLIRMAWIGYPIKGQLPQSQYGRWYGAYSCISRILLARFDWWYVTLALWLITMLMMSMMPQPISIISTSSIKFKILMGYTSSWWWV